MISVVNRDVIVVVGSAGGVESPRTRGAGLPADLPAAVRIRHLPDVVATATTPDEPVETPEPSP